MKSAQLTSFFGVSHLFVFLMLWLTIDWLRQGLPFDYSVSDLFFRDGEWLWPKRDEELTFWLHDFIKYIFVFLGLTCLAISIASPYIVMFRPYCTMALMITLSLIITPATIAEMKSRTHIFCPSKLEYYNGNFPDDYHKRDLENILLDKARCFPAGHASPGFALFVLGTGAATSRRKVVGYTIGLLAGSALSLVQIGRGEHFLSHCVASALIGLWVSIMLAYGVKYARHRGWI